EPYVTLHVTHPTPCCQERGSENRPERQAWNGERVGPIGGERRGFEGAAGAQHRAALGRAVWSTPFRTVCMRVSLPCRQHARCRGLASRRIRRAVAGRQRKAITADDRFAGGDQRRSRGRARWARAPGQGGRAGNLHEPGGPPRIKIRPGCPVTASEPGAETGPGPERCTRSITGGGRAMANAKLIALILGVVVALAAASADAQAPAPP